MSQDDEQEPTQPVTLGGLELAAEASGPVDAEAASASSSASTYRVQPGDSWESIAAGHGVDVDALYAANAEDARVVSAGRHGVPVNATILIPGQGA